MKFSYNENKKLPPLAWIAIIRGDIAEITHGEKLETNETFFIEGAWSGDFLNPNFDTSDWLCGTGAILKDGMVVFAAPTSMHAPLYFSKRRDGTHVVSNSLPFIMANEGLCFDPKYPNYETDFHHNILKGIHEYNPDIHAVKKDGSSLAAGSLKMIFFRNITIRDDGSVQISLKPKTKGFDDFEEYYSRMRATMCALAENARHLSRRFKYGVTSLISSGYDAATCASIAKEAGAKTALTFEAKGRYAGDSGVPAGTRLGLTVIERNPDSYKTRTDFVEAQCLSCGDVGVQISWACFEKDFKNNLVFSGQTGGHIWAKDSHGHTINDDYYIFDKKTEIGLCETHLHMGYIPVPMPNWGFPHWKDIFRISNSEEMKPWVLGNDYDRPIPRRILEGKGLPRNSFGVKKVGAGFWYMFDWKKRLLSRLSKHSAEDFERYLQEHRGLAPWKNYVRFIRANAKTYFNIAVSRFGLKWLALSSSHREIEDSYAISNPFAMRHLIAWGGGIIIRKYEETLKK